MRNTNFTPNGEIQFAFDEIELQVLKSWCIGDLCGAMKLMVKSLKEGRAHLQK